MSTTHPRYARRAFAALLALAQLLLGCPPANPPLAPAVGFSERREPNLVAVPGGVVDVAGGKLLVSRTDLVLDTRLGREALGAVYDSAAGAWRWSFDSRYDGATFVDESGASFAVAALAAGAAIPGTWWVKLDATRMKTKGGLVHEYGAGGLLAARYWASDPYPRIRLRTATVAGALRVTAIDQCTAATACAVLFTLGHDGAGRLASIVDRAGRRAEFTWDASGRLASARDALDVAKGWPGFRYTYFTTKLVSQTNSEGERVEYAYNSVSLVSVTQVGPGSPTYRSRTRDATPRASITRASGTRSARSAAMPTTRSGACTSGTSSRTASAPAGPGAASGSRRRRRRTARPPPGPGRETTHGFGRIRPETS